MAPEYDRVWFPWTGGSQWNVNMSPYRHARVWIKRADSIEPRLIDPRTLHPETNAIGLMWSPEIPVSGLMAGMNTSR